MSRCRTYSRAGISIEVGATFDEAFVGFRQFACTVHCTITGTLMDHSAVALRLQSLNRSAQRFDGWMTAN